MKPTHSVLIVLGFASSALLLPLAAQAQAPTATPSVSAPASDATASPGNEHAGRGGAWKDKWQKLTPEEREKVKAAHQKALQDPAVKAAEAEKSTDRRAYRKTVHEAMLRADPSVGPLLEKMRPAGGRHEKTGADE